MSKKVEPVHESIKIALGYEADVSDADFHADWKKRATAVCKPCWELKYCPYGPFVEQSPLIPSTKCEAEARREHLAAILANGVLGEKLPLSDETRSEYEDTIAAAKADPRVLAGKVARQLFMMELINVVKEENRDLCELLQPPTEDLHKSRVPYPLWNDSCDADEDQEVPEELLAAIQDEISRMENALSTGIDDQTQPLDDTRRQMFEKEVSEFDEGDYPDAIPEMVTDMACTNFGHICPVVFVGESITETSEKRRRGRYIPFDTKIRVVRRDNYTCQECGKHLKDSEVEFDHIIPHAKGGSSEEHNIRLTCFKCNRSKSDDVEI